MVKKKTRIKIKDLPRDMKVSREEMKKVFGGVTFTQTYTTLLSQRINDTLKQSGGSCGCGCQ